MSEISERVPKFDFDCCGKRALFFYFPKELAQNHLESKSELI